MVNELTRQILLASAFHSLPFHLHLLYVDPIRLEIDLVIYHTSTAINGDLRSKFYKQTDLSTTDIRTCTNTTYYASVIVLMMMEMK